MRTLYIDCGMGAAGDMLTAALLELIPDQDGFIAEFNSLGLPGIKMVKEPSIKCGIAGTHVSMLINGEEEGEVHHHHEHEHGHGHEHHHHSGLHDIEHIVKDHLRLDDKIKDDILSVFTLIAEAESSVHGESIENIHFHEVGTMDAVADITAVSMLIDKIGPDEIIVSPIRTGFGKVRCAHGILPVPAPATEYILRGMPIYAGNIEGELCTPTGAALLKHFASSFSQMPLMRIEAIGYGMGKKDFEAANCVRTAIGEREGSTDTVITLECNVDDMTGEEIGFASERLFALGAKDVYTVPIGMKKSRPGVIISVICQKKDMETLVRALFRYTTTIGIRKRECERFILDREESETQSEYGPVRVKRSSGYGTVRVKAEYDDLERIAKEHGITLRDIENIIKL